MPNSERRSLLPDSHGNDATIGTLSKKRSGSVNVNVVPVEGSGRNGYGGTDDTSGNVAGGDEEALGSDGAKPVKVKISRIVSARVH
jgi:hypothetical protein